MARFIVVLAFNVSCYKDLEVEADNEAEAIAKAKAQADSETFVVEWDSSESGEDDGETYRLVDVEEVIENE